MKCCSFWSGIVMTSRREVGRIRANGEYRAVVWWLPLGVIAFFALFFSNEVVGSLPIAVVDNDKTSLSRRLVSMIRATPQTALVEEMNDLLAAQQKMLEGDVVAVVEIADGFARKILSGGSAEVLLYDSGTNISANSLASKGVQTVATTFGVGVELQRAEMQGSTPEQAMAQSMPIAFTSYAMFNPWLNYAYYVAPCFLIMIILIATVLSTIYAVGIELRYATSVEWLRMANGSLVVALMGKLTPITAALWLLTVVVGALMFWLYGAPMAGSWSVLLLGAAAMIIAYQAVAIAVVALTASMRLALSIGGGYSVLAFTFSGVTFPTMAMFPAVQPFTLMFPYTYFMRLYIDQVVRGVDWWYSMQDLAAMLLFCLLPLLLFGRLRKVLVRRKFWGRL